MPFSVGWWEDQFFDMGLLGWEVVEWDPKEALEVETRNQYGGKFTETSFVYWVMWQDFGF